MSAATSSNHNLAKGLISAAVVGVGALLAYRAYSAPRSVRPGINTPFANSDPAGAATFLGRFEVESREIFNLMPTVVDALQIKSGDRVADLGAGTGLFLENLARAVAPHSVAAAPSTGRVFALDPSPMFLTHMQSRIAHCSRFCIRSAGGDVYR